MGAKPKAKMNRELVTALLDHEHPVPWEVEFELSEGWHVNDAEGDRVGSFMVQAHAHAIVDMAAEEVE